MMVSMPAMSVWSQQQQGVGKGEALVKTASASANEKSLQSAAGAIAYDLATSRKEPVACDVELTPYEAAAKAIFVKANGLSAYYRVTGILVSDENDADMTT